MSTSATANELYTNTNYIFFSEKPKQPNWSNDYMNSLMHTIRIKIVKSCFQRSVYGLCAQWAFNKNFQFYDIQTIISTTFGMKVVQTKGICIHAIKILVAQLVFLDISNRDVKDSNLSSPNINLSIKNKNKKPILLDILCLLWSVSHLK